MKKYRKLSMVLGFIIGVNILIFSCLSLKYALSKKAFSLKSLFTQKKEIMIESSHNNTASIHNFKVKTLTGQEFDFATLKGKKVMIVNTASKCGLTPQYKSLEKLYQTYKDKNLTIIGFPANNFMGQEPGSNDDIKQFCEINYGVSFPMMEKISVKGSDMSPVYEFLTQKSKNGLMDSDVEWNFQKYLINENGVLVGVIKPQIEPDTKEVIQWINQ